MPWRIKDKSVGIKDNLRRDKVEEARDQAEGRRQG